MSSEHDCVAETYSSKKLQDNVLLDHSALELQSSAIDQQKHVSSDNNSHTEEFNTVDCIHPLSTTIVHPSAKVKEIGINEAHNASGLHHDINQSENDIVHNSITPCSNNLEELKMKTSEICGISTEIPLNSISHTTDNFNHLYNQSLASSSPIVPNRELCSNFDLDNIPKPNNKILDEKQYCTANINFEDHTDNESHYLTPVCMDASEYQPQDKFDSDLPTNTFPDMHESATLTLLQNGQEEEISNIKLGIDDNLYHNKQNCVISNSEPVACSGINNSEHAMFNDSETEQSTCNLKNHCEDFSKSQSVSDDAVMQTFVEGTLQPLSISSSETKEPLSIVFDDDDSSSLFAGVSQEISLDQESSNVLDMIRNRSVEAVKIESDLTTGNLDMDTSLTDISAPVISSNSLCSLEPAVVNPVSSGLSTEFGHILELDGKPSYMKLLPLKNGHSLWNMHDLRLAVSQHGTVLLKLCASPNSIDRTITSQCNFSALLLDDDIPSNNSNNLLHNVTNPSQIKSMESRSCQTNFESLHSNINLVEGNCNPSMSEYPYELETSNLPDSDAIRHLCSPLTVTNRHYSLLATGGKKRGRPPVQNKDELIGSISAYSNMTEGTGMSPFKFSKKGSSMDAIWKKYKKLQKTEPLVCTDQRNLTTKEDREMSLGYKKLLSLTCVQCGAIFRNKGALSTHVKSKHRVFKKCRICHERIRMQDKYSLRRHLLKAHKDKEQLLCSKCNVSFKVMLHLKRHDRVIHESSDSSDISSSCEVGSESDGEEDNYLDECQLAVNVNKTDISENHSEIDQPSDVVNMTSKIKQPENIAQSESENDITGNINRPLRLSSMSSSDSGDSDESGNESDVEDSSSSDSEEKEESKNFKNDHSDDDSNSKNHIVDHSDDDSNSKNHISDHTDSKVDETESTDKIDKLSNDKSKNNSQLHSSLEDISVTENTKHCSSDDNESMLVSTKDEETDHRSAPKFTRACTRSGKYFSRDTAIDAKRNNPKNNNSNTSKFSGDASEDVKDGNSSKTKHNRPSYIIRRGRMFYCNKCNISFKREKIMTYHLKKIHETLYPFRACPDCGKIFRSCGPFNRHISQHKFTYCPVEGCSAKYRNVRLVKKHQKKGHPEYTHRCYRCIHLFKKKYQLNQHINESHKHAKNHEEEKGDEESEEVEEEKIVVERKKPQDYVPTVIYGKRERHGPVSYKEIDEEVNVTRRGTRKRTASESIDTTPTITASNKRLRPPKLKAVLPSSSMKSKIFSKRFAKISSKSENKGKKQITLTTKQKKITTSWTAALKAKYQANRVAKKITVEAINKSSKPKNSHSTSPAITDDVIRRVSNSLLSRKPTEIKKSKPGPKNLRLDHKSCSVVAHKIDLANLGKDGKHCPEPKVGSAGTPSGQSNKKPANVIGFDLF